MKKKMYYDEILYSYIFKKMCVIGYRSIPQIPCWPTCLPGNWSYNTEMVFFLFLGEGFFNSLLEDLEFEGQEFEADSWSMAVDSTYLQTHRKDVIKRQDVIYG